MVVGGVVLGGEVAEHEGEAVGGVADDDDFGVVGVGEGFGGFDASEL